MQVRCAQRMMRKRAVSENWHGPIDEKRERMSRMKKTDDWKPSTTKDERLTAFIDNKFDGMRMCATCGHFIQHFARLCANSVTPLPMGHCADINKARTSNVKCEHVCKHYVLRQTGECRQPVINDTLPMMTESDSNYKRRVAAYRREFDAKYKNMLYIADYK